MIQTKDHEQTTATISYSTQTLLKGKLQTFSAPVFMHCGIFDDFMALNAF